MQMARAFGPPSRRHGDNFATPDGPPTLIDGLQVTGGGLGRVPAGSYRRPAQFRAPRSRSEMLQGAALLPAALGALISLPPPRARPSCLLTSNRLPSALMPARRLAKWAARRKRQLCAGSGRERGIDSVAEPDATLSSFLFPLSATVADPSCLS